MQPLQWRLYAALTQQGKFGSVMRYGSKEGMHCWRITGELTYCWRIAHAYMTADNRVNAPLANQVENLATIVMYIVPSSAVSVCIPPVRHALV